MLRVFVVMLTSLYLKYPLYFRIELPVGAWFVHVSLSDVEICTNML